MDVPYPPYAHTVLEVAAAENKDDGEDDADRISSTRNEDNEQNNDDLSTQTGYESFRVNVPNLQTVAQISVESP